MLPLLWLPLVLLLLLLLLLLAEPPLVLPFLLLLLLLAEPPLVLPFVLPFVLLLLLLPLVMLLALLPLSLVLALPAPPHLLFSFDGGPSDLLPMLFVLPAPLLRLMLARLTFLCGSPSALLPFAGALALSG